MGKLTRLICLTIVLVTGCTGGSSDVAETATPTSIVTESSTEVPPTAATEEPTATSEPVVLSDEERLAAAVAVFEADPQPDELFAYDILESSFAAGRARITICGWNGDTVFDQVRLIIYRVSETPGPDGQPDVDFESASIGQGECQNSTLVESALQATRDYDEFWGQVLLNPESYDSEAALEVLVPELAAINETRAADWASAGLAFRSTQHDGQLPDSSLTAILGRRWTEEDVGGLELISCRELESEYGLYRGNVLIDDFKNEGSTGDHSILRYRMVRQEGKWRIFATEGLVWADCLGPADGWLASVNRSFPEPALWVAWSG